MNADDEGKACCKICDESFFKGKYLSHSGIGIGISIGLFHIFHIGIGSIGKISYWWNTILSSWEK